LEIESLILEAHFEGVAEAATGTFINKIPPQLKLERLLMANDI
jgi:hypothetical protein